MNISFKIRVTFSCFVMRYVFITWTVLLKLSESISTWFVSVSRVGVITPGGGECACVSPCGREAEMGKSMTSVQWHRASVEEVQTFFSIWCFIHYESTIPQNPQKTQLNNQFGLLILFSWKWWFCNEYPNIPMGYYTLSSLIGNIMASKLELIFFDHLL